MSVPYPLTPPQIGPPDWGPAVSGALASVRDRIRLHEQAYSVPLDAFTGRDDDARFSAALAYAAQQTHSPAIVLPARTIDLHRGPYRYFPGMRLTGPLGSGEREFTSTGPHCVVRVGRHALFEVPQDGVRNVWITGIQFRAAYSGIDWQTRTTDFAHGPLMQDVTIERCGWVGFAAVMHARHLRCRIDYTYCNESSDTPFKLAGSDNAYWLGGQSYLSSIRLTADRFYVHFPHMSRTRVGAIFITPERATGIRIDGSYGDLQFDGTYLDSTHRSKTTACQGAAVLVTGGQGMVFSRCWFFGNCVNPASTGRHPRDQGQVHIRGTAREVLFTGCSWGGFAKQAGHTPPGTPAIYAARTAAAIKVHAPLAPYGGEKLLHQEVPGIISTGLVDDWTVRVS